MEETGFVVVDFEETNINQRIDNISIATLLQLPEVKLMKHRRGQEVEVMRKSQHYLQPACNHLLQPDQNSWRLLVILVFRPPQNLESTLHKLVIAPKDHQNLARPRINCN